MTPVIPVGFSRQWMAFPGTLSLRRETVAAVVDDLIKSLIHHGVDRVLIINGHGRNSAILNDLCLRIRYETGALISHVDWFKIVHAHLDEVGLVRPASEPAAGARLGARDGGHARDRGGTKRAAGVDGPGEGRPPRRRRCSRASTSSRWRRPRRPSRSASSRSAAYFPSLGLDGTEHSDDGLLGDPTPATAETGARVLELVGVAHRAIRGRAPEGAGHRPQPSRHLLTRRPVTLSLTIVGSGTPVPTAERFGSAYLVDLGTERLLFDCGPATTYKLARSASTRPRSTTCSSPTTTSTMTSTTRASC